MKERKGEEHQKSIKKFQTQSRHTVLREKRLETGKKASKIKASQTFIATPKPWVAGSNPPAPAKNPRSCWARIFTFSLFTLNFSLLSPFCSVFWKEIGNSEK